MENNIIKKLIVLGAIVFSVALANNTYAAGYAFSNSPVTRFYSNSAAEYAGQGYSQYTYYQQSNIGYNQVPMAPINNPYVQYSYYQQSGYNNTSNDTTSAKPTTVVNNYYQAAPATTAKTSTTTKTTTDTSDTSAYNTNGVYSSSNSLGASAYGNGITALSFRGSGSFMPSSIWQWMLVIVLILIIIIIARILMKKPTLEVQEAHSAHAH